MSEINTQKLEYTGTTAPANTTKVSEAAFGGAHAGAASRAPAVVIVDANLDDAVGAKSTASVQPDGGSGLLGWLSGIYTRAGEIVTALGATINTRVLSSATDSVSIGGSVAVSNFPASQPVSGEVSVGNFPASQAVSGTVTANLGTLNGAATAALQTTGNTSLSAIDGKLPTLGQKASAGSLPVVLSSDQPALNVKAATGEALTYFTGISVVPTALTTGLNLFFLRNTSATKKIKIQKIEIIMVFSGTAAATRSLYAIKKLTGVTATTGTVTLTPVPGQTGNPVSVADVKWAAAGGTLTGGTLQGTNVMSIGHANQLATNIVYDRGMTEAPLTLLQNETISLQTDGAIVAGSTVIISLRWTEE
jgi:hypothetical protein